MHESKPITAIKVIMFPTLSDSFASIEFATHSTIDMNVKAPKKSIIDKICFIVPFLN